jgi:hypothetical protein
LNKNIPQNAQKPDWLLIAVCAVVFILLLLLPLIFGGKREDAYFTYKIMWLNYLGHRFKLPLETPKPLFAFLCGVVGHGALYPVICGLSAGVLALLMKISQKMSKPFWAGLVAFFLFMAGNTIVLPEFVMSAYYPMLYFFLVLATVYSFLNKWNIVTMFCLLGAGLVRPEAWLFPPVLILLTMFKKERGFSRWLFVPLLAPVIWALFDHRISGSPTYSRDMTNYYMQTLGVMPVSFKQYWAAAGRNIMSVFNLPVHLFGLAGLVYFTVRKRGAGHLIIAILAVLPFLFFWLLSAASPVIIQVRFFAFSMLVCCFYAVLLLTELSRSKWILGVSCAALACVGAQSDMLASTAAMVRIDKEIAGARASTLETIRKMEKKADVILCGRSAGYYAYHLGEKASQKIFMFREAETRQNFEQGISRGVAIYIKEDIAGMDRAFSFLSRPQLYNANGFRFIPVEISRCGNGIVYAFERMPDVRGKK